MTSTSSKRESPTRPAGAGGYVNACLLLARRNATRYALSSSLTAFSIALAAGLAMAVFAVQRQAIDAFTNSAGDYDAVLGARGSSLQLVLNSVFHLETSPGNIPWSIYQEVAQTPGIERAVPLAVGDSYRGFRIAGTTEAFFRGPGSATDREVNISRFQWRPGGRLFHPEYAEAMVGAAAARAAGLALGDVFHPSHGVNEAGGEAHELAYTVVAVLEPTNSPVDRVIWIPIEGVYRMDGHVLRGAGEDHHARPGTAIPDEHKEVSAVLLELANPAVGFRLNAAYRNDPRATLAFPIAAVIADLFDKLGWAIHVLTAVAYLTVLAALAGLVASIYNTLNERRGEMAILRALGAPRGFLLALPATEAALIGLAGALGGYAVYALILGVARHIVRQQTGVVLEMFAPHPALIWALPAITGLSALTGLIPGWRAFRVDVSTALDA